MRIPSPVATNIIYLLNIHIRNSDVAVIANEIAVAGTQQLLIMAV